MAGSTAVVRAGIADIVKTVDPHLAEALGSGAAAHLRLIAIAADIQEESRAMLRSSVDAARSVGASWEQIGDVLNISRQAAQQRFGSTAPAPEADRWRMTPVTALDEMERLNEAGRHGWHSVGYGFLYHDMERSDQQWEHRRVSAFASRSSLESRGWQKIGRLWFPWAYYARPTGKAALSP